MARYKFADLITTGGAPGSDVVKPGRAFYNGVASLNVEIELVDGTSIKFVNCPIGVIPVAFTKVLSAGTTSTELLALQ